MTGVLLVITDIQIASPASVTTKDRKAAIVALHQANVHAEQFTRDDNVISVYLVSTDFPTVNNVTVTQLVLDQTMEAPSGIAVQAKL